MISNNTGRIEEIKQRIKDIDAELIEYENGQMALKLFMNSLYGSFGNKYFRYYDQRVAEAITSTGKLVILWAERTMNNAIREITGNKDKDYIIAIDTDSVAGDTIIEVNGTKITISEFYNIINEVYLRKDVLNEDFVKQVDGFTTPSINKFGNLEYKQIKYVMKHKVKKKMYKILDSNGNSVIVTEDHSIIVKCKNTLKIMSIKPENLDTEKHNIINIIAMDTDKKDNLYDNKQKFTKQSV